MSKLSNLQARIVEMSRLVRSVRGLVVEILGLIVVLAYLISAVIAHSPL
jgi:hypothetical protein